MFRFQASSSLRDAFLAQELGSSGSDGSVVLDQVEFEQFDPSSLDEDETNEFLTLTAKFKLSGEQDVRLYW